MQLGNCAHLLGVPDEEELEGHTLQFVTSCGSEGYARVITVE